MINKDYKSQLKQIEEQLENRQYAKALENIEWLKGLRPIPLELSTVEAKYHLRTGNYALAQKCLDNKWKPDYNREALVKVMEVYEELWDEIGDELEWERYHYMKQHLQYMGTTAVEWQECQDKRNELERLGQQFYAEGNPDILNKMAKIAYTMTEVAWYVVIQQYFHRKETTALELTTHDWIEELPNMSWIREQLEQPSRCVILVTEEENRRSCGAMARILTELEKQVYIIEPPTLWEALNEDLVMADESFRLEKQDDLGIHEIPSFFLEDGSGQRMDNRAAIIASLLQWEDRSGGLALVIASGTLMNDLDMEEVLKKQYSRFNFGLGDIFESNLSMGWAGDYQKYISTIYDHDVSEWLQRKVTVRYSIVIPVERSAETLRSTLKTCLELDYPKEQYEIVISDNSAEGDTAIYALCEELKDNRIRYYRTRRELNASKHFEFAFLQTQGEFVIAIGENDGVLPWALQVLDQVRSEHPYDSIIQWQHGVYAWPGFNGGQENQFVLPGKYEQSIYGTHYITRIQYIRELLQDPQFMHSLPMLYVNSGCSRDYVRHILRETGRLWDGKSPDIYMGVMNTLINNQILNLRYPLTIIGLADGSANKSTDQSAEYNGSLDQTQAQTRKAGNVGGFSMSMTERLFPDLPGLDTSDLYVSLLRAAARDVLPETYLWEIFDWKTMFWNCASKLDARNPEFDKLIHSARYAASWHGEKFLKWFDDAIYEPIIQPTRYDDAKLEKIYQEKAYEEGPIGGGGLVADASKYGVKDIYDAVQLFVKLSGLGEAKRILG